MFEGMFQPLHLIALAVVGFIVYVIGRLLWRLGDRK